MNRHNTARDKGEIEAMTEGTPLRRRHILALGVAAACLFCLLVGPRPALAEEALASFVVYGAPASPLPVGLAHPPDFHAGAVDLDGDLRLSFIDLSIPARGWPLAVERTWHPDVPDQGLGPGWAWSFGSRFILDRDTGDWSIIDPDGVETVYTLAGDEPDGRRRYRPLSGALGTVLVGVPGGRLERLHADGAVEHFATGDGRLLARRGPDGQGYALDYDDGGRLLTVTHDDGRRLTMTHAGPRVTALEDPLGRVWRFEHDRGGHLSRTVDPLDRETLYAHMDGRLSALNLADGQTLRVTYGPQGDVTELAGPGPLRTRFTHLGRAVDGRLVQARTDATGVSTRTELVRDPADPERFTLTTIDPAGAETVRDYRHGQVDVSVAGQWLGGLLLDAAGAPVSLFTARGIRPIGPYDGTPDTIAEPDAGADRPYQDRMAEGLAEFQGRVLLLLSGRDLVAREFEDLARASPLWRRAMARADITRHPIEPADHTFSTEAWRTEAARATADWLADRPVGSEG